MTTLTDSSMAEYERLLSHRSAPHTSRGRVAALVFVAPVLGYVFVRAGVEILDAELSSDGRSLFTDAQSQALAIWGALSAALLVVGDRVAGRLRPVTGVDEDVVRTGHFLARLPSPFTVLRGLRLPTGDSIDHVVVGPTGLFVVLTEHCDHDVVVDGRRARCGRRSMHKLALRARALTAEVSRLAGVPATPIVCIHGADVTVRTGAPRPTVSGVRFCAARDVQPLVSDRPSAIAELDVHHIATQLVWS